jgi:hypothetical protein
LSNRRLIETTVLGLIGLLLAVGVVNDVVRQVHTNHRLNADLATWRGYTGHDYRNLQTEQAVNNPDSTREVICGNTSPGAPKAHQQLCLIMTGPVVDGRRTVHGGYFLPPLTLFDVPHLRYACFGVAKSQELCER